MKKNTIIGFLLVALSFAPIGMDNLKNNANEDKTVQTMGINYSCFRSWGSCCNHYHGRPIYPYYGPPYYPHLHFRPYAYQGRIYWH